MPDGLPAKLSGGSGKAGCGASVIRRIERLAASASAGVPPTKRGDRRRGRHGETADAQRLGDRRVADVGVGVVGSVAGEEQAVGRADRGGEPPVAGARDADAELDAVAGHRRHQRRARHVVRRRPAQLAGGHREVEEKWSLPARNLSTSTAPSRGGDRQGASRRASSAEAATFRLWPSSPIASAWPISVVTSIGSDARMAASRTGPSTSVIQRSRSMTSGAVGAEAQHLAQPLVEGGEGVPRRRPGVVDDLPDRHRRGDDAGHRADGPVVVARLDGDLARGERPLGLLGVAAQPSKRAAPIRAPRIGPHIREHAIGGPACSMVRSGPASAPITARAGRMPTTRGRTACTAAMAARVGRGRRLVVEGDHRARRGEVGERRRAPVELRHVRRRHALDDQREPGVDHLHATVDHGRPPSASVPPASRIASRAAAALDPASSTPASRSVRAWRVEALRIGGRAADRGDERHRPAGGGPGLADGGRDRAGRVGVGAVAEHDVEQHHADRRVRRGLRRSAPRAPPDRSSGAGGPRCTGRRRGRSPRPASPGPAEQHLGLPGERPAGVQARAPAPAGRRPPAARRAPAPA